MYKVKFKNKSNYPDREITYPLALLGDIELHFTHYKTEEEANTKWTRRTARMLKETNKNNYIFMMSDAWYAKEQNFKDFGALPLKNKLSFSIHKFEHLSLTNHFQILEIDRNFNDRVPNGVKLFKIKFIYMNLYKWMKERLS